MTLRRSACSVRRGRDACGPAFTRVIGETVAMGMDNDCTATTAGSIVGAVVGKRRIPLKWCKSFGDTIHSYLVGQTRFSIRDVLRRFETQAKNIHGQPTSPGDVADT